jgi:hypothetical protein
MQEGCCPGAFIFSGKMDQEISKDIKTYMIYFGKVQIYYYIHCGTHK